MIHVKHNWVVGKVIHVSNPCAAAVSRETEPVLTKQTDTLIWSECWKEPDES